MTEQDVFTSLVNIVFTLLLLYQLVIDKDNKVNVFTYFIILIAANFKYFTTLYSVFLLFPLFIFMLVLILFYDALFTKTSNQLD